MGCFKVLTSTATLPTAGLVRDSFEHRDRLSERTLLQLQWCLLQVKLKVLTVSWL